MVKLFSFFTDKGVPKTGLSPTISIWEDDGSVIVSAAAMTEVDGGFYVYDFTTYDDSKDYVIRADGGAVLQDSERYTAGSNEIGQVTTDTGDLLDVQKNRWKIDSTTNELIIYETDGTTVKYSFDLKDKNGSPNSINIFERVPK